MKVGTEAAFHAVEEYMKYVAEWFDQYELTKKVRLHFFVSTAPQNVTGPCLFANTVCSVFLQVGLTNINQLKR